MYAVISLMVASAWAGVEGYYRSPALFEDTVVFSAEGDLWRVSTAGGAAIRLTSHPEGERFAVFSPDGQEVAFFVRRREGP
jgi:tricorn protease